MEHHGYFTIPEPKLSFEAFTASAYHIHPLKGLIDFGPYSHKLIPIDSIRIATIYPEGTYHIIETLIREFETIQKPRERLNYLPEYTGFSNIFHSKIQLAQRDVSISVGREDLFSSNAPYIELSEALSNGIRAMAQRKQDYDVLIIYLPESWQPAFEDKASGFDLHDFLKATTAMHNIPTQIVREGSAIRYKCRCSVMWRLSIALYVKAGGIPWKLSSIDQDTAFVGLSYSTRLNTHTKQHDFTTCCSQVFDADGTGLEFIAYDAAEVESRIGENPFLTRAEMRKLMSKSLLLYQRRHAGKNPKRLIVHKTTHFKSQEIDGAFDAVPSNINLELLQIVQEVPWKGIKYDKQQGKWNVPGYPLNRGIYFQTGPQEILLWTQGLVNLGLKHFFKEGKGTPSPLMIRRFAGDGGWDQNCQAILGLTKMNWNHDALYDRLPVTLGYASVLARTIKRMSELVNKPYEFRYFM